MKQLAPSLLLASALGIPAALKADSVTCESRNHQRQECPFDALGAVRLVQQLSHADCEEGRSWGVEAGRVWVDDGCRAVFDTSRTVMGEPPGAEPRPVTSAANLPRRVTCESRNRQRTDCDMDTRGEVRMVRRLSTADCKLGISWGLFQHRVWVDRGCRAVFQSEGTDDDHPPDRLPGWAVRACNSVEYDHGRVINWTNPRPGAYEMTLEDSRGQFECQVMAGGKVTGYLRRGVPEPGSELEGS